MSLACFCVLAVAASIKVSGIELWEEQVVAKESSFSEQVIEVDYQELYEFAKELEACSTLILPEYAKDCARNVGGRIMARNMDDTAFIEKVCMSGAAHQVRPCISGAVRYYLLNGHSLAQAMELCWVFEQPSQQACEWAVTFPEQ